jgi:hypothetical protein
MQKPPREDAEILCTEGGKFSKKPPPRRPLGGWPPNTSSGVAVGKFGGRVKNSFCSGIRWVLAGIVSVDSRWNGSRTRRELASVGTAEKLRHVSQLVSRENDQAGHPWAATKPGVESWPISQYAVLRLAPRLEKLMALHAPLLRAHRHVHACLTHDVPMSQTRKNGARNAVIWARQRVSRNFLKLVIKETYELRFRAGFFDLDDFTERSQIGSRRCHDGALCGFAERTRPSYQSNCHGRSDPGRRSTCSAWRNRQEVPGNSGISSFSEPGLVYDRGYPTSPRAKMIDDRLQGRRGQG